jgi:hypothetical protein
MGSSDDQKQIVGRLEAFDPGPSIAVAVEALASIGADYAMIGGLALDAWGISRATKDVDFAVHIGVAEKLSPYFLAAGAEVRPLRIGGLGVRIEKPSIRIDLIDRRFYFAPLFVEAIKEASQSKRVVQSAEREVPLVSLEYLLAMKLVSGEPKDDIDARRILALEALNYQKAKAIIEQHLGNATANRLDTWAREVGRPEVTRRPYRDSNEQE